MAKKPENRNPLADGDPKRGDAILKRMLKTKPKLQKEMKKGKTGVSTDDKKERPSS